MKLYCSAEDSEKLSSAYSKAVESIFVNLSFSLRHCFPVCIYAE